MCHAVRHIQQVGKGKLGNGRGAVGRNVGDDDSSLVSGLDVYHIIPCGQHTDVAQTRQLADDFTRQDNLVRQHGIGLPTALDDVGRRGAVVNLHADIWQTAHRLPVEVVLDNGVSIEYDEIHRRFIILFISYLPH